MVGLDGKSKPLPFTKIFWLDGLGINLVTICKLYDKKFVSILRGSDPEGNKKGKLPPHCVSQKVAQILKEFDDVLTNEFPNKLPSKIEVDHKIELAPGVEFQHQAPYLFNPTDLVELKWQ